MDAFTSHTQNKTHEGRKPKKAEKLKVEEIPDSPAKWPSPGEVIFEPLLWDNVGLLSALQALRTKMLSDVRVVINGIKCHILWLILV